jgi:hypothetical protein
MKAPFVYFVVALAISTVSSSPIPQDTTASPLNINVPASADLLQEQGGSSFGSKLGNLAMASASVGMLVSAGIGISEWVLHWYTRLLSDKDARRQQNQSVQEENHRQEEEFNRRERAFDLMLEMAENYSDEVASKADFAGNFMPLSVPPAIVGAVENVFKQTAGVEGTSSGGGTDVTENLDGLKNALKPVMSFKVEDDNQ